MEILNMEQGSIEWFEARKGILTSSDFQTVLMKGRGGGDSQTRRTLLLKKAGERITGEPMENFTNGYMERGKEQEPIARNLYQEATGNEVTECGFIRNGKFGASTDGLIDGGIIEIKTRAAHLQINLLLSGEVPKEHEAQIQGGMMIADRGFLDFISYCPNMPLFIQRVERDEKYIAILKDELEKANEEIEKIVQQVMERF